MHSQRLNITFPYELAQDLRRTIPPKNRSRFIAQKKKNRHLTKELIRSLKANKNFYKQVTEDWKYVDAGAFRNLP